MKLKIVAILFVLSLGFVSGQEIVPIASIENHSTNNSINITNIELPEDFSIDTLILWIIALGALALLFVLFVGGIYIYQALAFVKIAKKNKFKDGWMAWIPFIGTWIVAAKIVKANWWPIFLPFIFTPIEILSSLLGLIKEPSGNIILTIEILDLLVEITFLVGPLAFFVFFVLWHWKLFNKMKMPGWPVIFSIVPIVGQIIYLVLIGVAAWVIKENKAINI